MFNNVIILCDFSITMLKGEVTNLFVIELLN